jgi:glycosyltransferase involved in cell wall biosynthesis
MPEFWRGDEVPPVDAVWVPTSWRIDHLPESTRLVPMPVALDRLARQPEPKGDVLRVLHVAGHRAAADRNGTQLVLKSAVRMRQRVHLTIAGQDRRLPSYSVRRGGPVSLDTRPGGIADYWRLYEHQDVLLMPRRYGGLCLPVQEGLAAGLVPIMPDVSPNMDWPIVPVPASMNGSIATQGGVLRMAKAKPADLAAAVDRLAADPFRFDRLRGTAGQWAADHSWGALHRLWMDELGRTL